VQLSSSGARVVRMSIVGHPVSAVLAEHIGLLLAVQYARGKPISVVADCQAVIQGFAKLRCGSPAVRSTRNPYGGIWAQIHEIEDGQVVVQEMCKVKAHLDYAGSVALGQGGWHAGNEKADLEAGLAACKYVTAARVEFERELRVRAKWLGDVAAALAKMEWTDWKRVGKMAVPYVGRFSGVGPRSQGRVHRVCWSPAMGRWQCCLCGRWSKLGKKGASHKLARRSCVPVDFFEGVGTGHSVAVGWYGDQVSLLFCVCCGRQRASRSQGLQGPCDPSVANRTRVRRAQEGCNPLTGGRFDFVTRPSRALSAAGASPAGVSCDSVLAGVDACDEVSAGGIFVAEEVCMSMSMLCDEEEFVLWSPTWL
jgi:hypothetical protein